MGYEIRYRSAVVIDRQGKYRFLDSKGKLAVTLEILRKLFNKFIPSLAARFLTSFTVSFLLFF